MTFDENGNPIGDDWVKALRDDDGRLTGYVLIDGRTGNPLGPVYTGKGGDLARTRGPGGRFRKKGGA